jgi:hypothetical protein
MRQKRRAYTVDKLLSYNHAKAMTDQGTNGVAYRQRVSEPMEASRDTQGSCWFAMLRRRANAMQLELGQPCE